MHQFEACLEKDFIIWNSEFGVCDFVTIGEVDSNNKKAWLAEPYEMVGPFCLDELCHTGQISFEACVVMSKQRWQTKQSFLRNESFKKQQKAQEKFTQEIHGHNKKRQFSSKQCCEKEHRELLYLPLEEQLEEIQIKMAFKKVAKKTHPDVGGSHEKFIKITQARDFLLQNLISQR